MMMICLQWLWVCAIALEKLWRGHPGADEGEEIELLKFRSVSERGHDDGSKSGLMTMSVVAWVYLKF